MSKNKYEIFGLNMSKQQLKKVINSAEKGIGVTIRLTPLPFCTTIVVNPDLAFGVLDVYNRQLLYF